MVCYNFQRIISSYLLNFSKIFRKGVIINLLKVVSAIFVLVYFLSLNESTCQTRKNVFYFTSKALFVLEKIKF